MCKAIYLLLQYVHASIHYNTTIAIIHNCILNDNNQQNQLNRMNDIRTCDDDNDERLWVREREANRADTLISLDARSYNTNISDCNRYIVIECFLNFKSTHWLQTECKWRRRKIFLNQLPYHWSLVGCNWLNQALINTQIV